MNFIIKLFQSQPKKSPFYCRFGLVFSAFFKVLAFYINHAPKDGKKEILLPFCFPEMYKIFSFTLKIF